MDKIEALKKAVIDMKWEADFNKRFYINYYFNLINKQDAKYKYRIKELEQRVKELEGTIEAMNAIQNWRSYGQE